MVTMASTACFRAVIVLLLLLMQAVKGLPPGFIEEGVTRFSDTTEVSFAPKTGGGHIMLVAIKRGEVYVVVENPNSDAVQRIMSLDLRSETCTEGERGLQGIQPHPDFLTNRWVYLYYAHKGDTQCQENRRTGPRNRLSRFTMNSDYTLRRNSEIVLFTTSPLEKKTHNGGDIAFGNDGYLYVTVGDGGSRVEGVSQDLGDLLGSIVRVTDDGGIPPDNPYTGSGSARCNQNGVVPSGSPSGTKCREIFASGLRNPFRFVMDPNTPSDEVRFLVNDVGGKTWEEVNEGGSRFVGANYGWPSREGPCQFSSTTNCPVRSQYDDPLHYYLHDSEGGGAAVGVEIPPNGVWPTEYDDSFLFIDFVFDEIYHMRPINGRECRDCIPPRSGFRNTTFHRSDRMVDLQFGPYYRDGGGTGQALYYTTRDTGGSRDSIRRIIYVGGGNRLPVARMSASETVVSVGEDVEFDASRSSDADGDQLTFEWDFDDGTQRTADAVVTHRFGARGTYSVTVRVLDGEGGSDEKTVDIRVGVPPTASILSPSGGVQFAVGDILTLVGSGIDGGGNQLPDRLMSWEVRQHHNTHFHPFLTSSSGNNIVLSPAPEPEDFLAATNSYLEVLLTVTDEDGLSTTVTRDIMPKTVWLDFDSVPPGLEVSMDGEVLTMPQRVLSWENHRLSLVAPDQDPYVFLSWSQGGGQSQRLPVPLNVSGVVPSYVATFVHISLRSAAPSTSAVPTNIVSIAPTSVPTSLQACEDYDVDYDRMCFSTDPCCEPIRSDTNYCWDIYDNVFPTDESLRDACSECCPGKEVGDANPPLPGVPQTIKCSDVENPFRMCKADSCCSDPRPTNSAFCDNAYELYGDDIEQICHYCCRGSTGPPSVSPTIAPVLMSSPTSLPTSPPTQTSTTLAPSASSTTSLVCEDYDVAYDRMCFSLDPCCESVRSDTNYCWDIYDNVFPTDQLLRAACSECCPGKDVGDANPPLPGVPQTIRCSDVENPFRMCKTNSCCSNPRPANSGFCDDAYALYGEDVEQICHYCCREPQMVGPPIP